MHVGCCENCRYLDLVENLPNGCPRCGRRMVSLGVDSVVWNSMHPEARKAVIIRVLTEPELRPGSESEVTSQSIRGNNSEDNLTEHAPKVEPETESESESQKQARPLTGQERLSQLKAERKRQAKLKAEQERLAELERARQEEEQRRLEKLKAEQERQEKLRAEAIKQAEIRGEQIRLAELAIEEARRTEQLVEEEQQAHIRAEKKRLAEEKAEKERAAGYVFVCCKCDTITSHDRSSYIYYCTECGSIMVDTGYKTSDWAAMSKDEKRQISEGVKLRYMVNEIEKASGHDKDAENMQSIIDVVQDE